LADEWGLVVNEAMAAGLPVLGSLYSQAVEDLILDNVTGWTFYPDQDTQMYQAINRALTTPREVMNQMRAACQQHIEHLTPDSAAEGIMQAIRYVCSHPRELAKTLC
jgi:glycosyltransferase involved in cell wall biosynthesis